MIVPSRYTNSDGDIVFEFFHASEDKKEANKLFYDRKSYCNLVTIDPVTNTIIDLKCECPAFQFGEGEPCKHLKQNIESLVKLGVKNYGYE